jgi:hypothetical protein
MPIAITGTGTITGISAGGLPDDCITTAEIAGSAVTPAKLSGAQSGSAPIFGARAWVNFDGTRNETGGSDTATTNRFIRASGNVSSVLRNGVGDYTVNFTVAMQDVNYAATGITGIESGNCFITPQSPFTTVFFSYGLKARALSSMTT